MSKIDQKYIDNLQNFSDALENIVVLLQEQVKSGGKAGNTDTVNTMLGNLDADKIGKIVEDLEAINGRTKKIEGNTEKILAEVKAANRGKETGMFASIQDPKNKEKIVDGIKSIVLIAGAVMLVGLAFKVVGKVDFLSVIGLSISLYILAETFSKIASIKDLSPAKAIQTGYILSSISGALLLSGFILSQMPTIGVAKSIAIGIIGISIGVATMGLISALRDMKRSDIWMVGIIPLLLPTIAGGIVASAFILNQLPTVGIMQLITAIGVGISLIPIAFAFSLIVKNLKDVNPKTLGIAALSIPTIAASIVLASYAYQGIMPIKLDQFLSAVGIGISLIPIVFAFSLIVKSLKDASPKSINFAAAAIPIIAVGLVAASLIYQKMATLSDFWGVITTSLAIGVSVIFMLPAFIILAKANLSMQGLLYGALGILVISGVIMLASWILSVGNYSKYPTTDWAAGVGLSILAIVPSIIVLGFIALSGVGAIALGLGALMMLGVAALIVGISYILGKGDYSKYPSAKWAAGVGLSMLAFMTPMIALGLMIAGTLGFGALVGFIGAKAMLGIAELMVEISNVFKGASFTAYPSTQWVNGVSSAMMRITKAVSDLPFIDTYTKKIKNVTDSIVDVAATFTKNSKLFKEPSPEWVSNIKNIFSIFSNIPKSTNTSGVDTLITSIGKLSSIGSVNLTPILQLTAAIGGLSNSLNDLNTDGIDKLTKLSGGMMVLSLVDRVKLEDVINTLDDKKKELSMVMDFSAAGGSQRTTNISTIANAKGGSGTTIDLSASVNTSKEQLSVLKEISRKIDDLTNRMDKIDNASNVGVFNR